MDDDQQSRPKTVLVIDDEAPVREAVSDVMEVLGIRVMAVDNGRAGIALYQEKMNEIDLVLLDLSMPGMSGKETLTSLRHLNPMVKVLLSSGYSAEDLIPPTDAVTGFLQKPYNVDNLIRQVSELLM